MNDFFTMGSDPIVFEFGLCAVIGGMTVIALVACIMMQVCCETAAELKVK